MQGLSAKASTSRLRVAECFKTRVKPFILGEHGKVLTNSKSGSYIWRSRSLHESESIVHKRAHDESTMGLIIWENGLSGV